MNSRVTGLIVRFFMVMIPTGKSGTGNSTGKILSGGRLAPKCNKEPGKIPRKGPLATSATTKTTKKRAPASPIAENARRFVYDMKVLPRRTCPSVSRSCHQETVRHRPCFRLNRGRQPVSSNIRRLSA